MRKTSALWGCLALFSVTQGYAQNITTINYTNAPLTSACNALDVSPLPVIGGMTHLPICGGVIYKSNALQLPTIGNALQSQSRGTAYGINYPFKKGHTYTIELMAAGTTAAGQQGPTVYTTFRSTIPDVQQTQPAICGTVPNTSWSAVQNGPSFDLSGKEVKTYGVPTYTPSADQSLMTILAVSYSNGGNDTVKISRVSILDKVSLPLTPATVVRECSDATPVNVRVDNPNGVVVTSYEWDLGSTDNGWTYGGNPAPQKIVTSSAVNVITLTPICGKTRSNIKVTALVDGKTYEAGTVAVSTPTTPVAITGPSTMCVGGAFTVNNGVLPCNTSVAWTNLSTGVVKMTVSNNYANFTKIYDDEFSFSATISGGCLQTPVTVVKKMIAGNGVSAYYTAGPDGPSIPTPMPTSPTPNFSSSYYITYFCTLNPTGLSNITWSTTYEAPYVFNGGDNGFTMTNMRNGSLVYVVLDADGSCGHIHKEYPFLSLISGKIPGGFAMDVWPNPATGAINVSTSVKSGTSSVANVFSNAKVAKVYPEAPSPYKVYAVKITDISGKIVKQVQYKDGVTSLNLPLGGIKSGYYILSAFDGRQWTSKSILVNE